MPPLLAPAPQLPPQAATLPAPAIAQAAPLPAPAIVDDEDPEHPPNNFTVGSGNWEDMNNTIGENWNYK